MTLGELDEEIHNLEADIAALREVEKRAASRLFAFEQLRDGLIKKQTPSPFVGIGDVLNALWVEPRR
jgi:hypothetical protein